MAAKIRYFFQDKINLLFLFFSAILALNSLYFLSSQGEVFPLFYNSCDHYLFYFIYFSFSVSGVGLIFFKLDHVAWSYFLGKILLLFFPSELIFIYGLEKAVHLVPYVGMAAAVYIFLFLIYLIIHRPAKTPPVEIQTIADDKKISPLAVWLIIGSVMLISLAFGTYHLGKFAAVDESLWTFMRIPDTWKNIAEKNWYLSRVSDKPGLTVAAISGTGLFFEKNPKQFKDFKLKDSNLESQIIQLEKFNFTFRFPMLLFFVFSLPILYFFIRKLLGESSALLAVIFIGLSPILIGNARIINPDSILWIFTSLSLLAYLINLRQPQSSFLYWSALFLSLGLLTKYTSTILYLYFFLLIFAEYIFNYAVYKNQLLFEYLKAHFSDYARLVAISFSIFFVFYPAVWEEPSRVFIGTIYSQPFKPIWPFFATLLSLVLLDFIFLKSALTEKIIRFFIKIRRVLFISIISIFLLSIVAVIINTYSHMVFFDFIEILSSPKSSFKTHGLFGFFLADFYPLLFGISLFSLIAFIIFLVVLIFRKKDLSDRRQLIIFYIVLFILCYYAGSVFSRTAMTIRYQIILFPLIFITASIALADFLNNNPLKSFPYFDKINKIPIYFALIIILSYSLYQLKPFYMGYASPLLPKKYYLDTKDMGEGSYEAAAYLNSLPQASKLKIWTDKSGVCTFFVGSCFVFTDSSSFLSKKIDYFVLSSGRRNRTLNIVKSKNSNPYSFSKMYEQDVFAHKIIIGGRSSNYVKIIKSADAFK